MIGKELKVYDGLTPRQQLNLFRNLYYNDGNATEHGIIANAINDCFAADVVPKSEVAREIFEEIEFDIHQLDFDREETRAIAIEGVIAKLKKKYTEEE